MGIIYAILIFCFIIFFHEFGHFIVAKSGKIDVHEFAIGMGPKIFSKIYKGTRYSIRLLPIGGFCAMGEDEEATDEPGNFNNRPVGIRIAVIAAGAVFNFILAFILSVVLIAMSGYDKPVIGNVESGGAAQEAGLQAGDVIVKLGNKRIHLFREIQYYNQFHQGEKTEVTFRRDGEIHQVMLTPKYDEKYGYYRFYIEGAGAERANVLTALQYGTYEVKFWIDLTLKSLQMLVTGQVSVKELSGPVGIVSMVDESYKETKSYGVSTVIAQFLYIGILISANLGVFNLLPIPALDGGRLVFLIVEAITKKRVPSEKEGLVHTIGFALLMLLMIFVLFNDIKRIFM